MTGDIYLGKLFGIPFRLHWSWFLAVFLIAWTLSVGFFPQTLPEYGGETAWFWMLGLLAALGLFLSVLLHEFGHIVVAQRVGIPVRGIRLFVFGGVAELGGEPKKPSQEILVAVGGPAVTVLLIVLYQLALAAILSVGQVRWELTDGLLGLHGGSSTAAGAAAVVFYLGLINTVILIFNLIPAFPLDGGRVLRGIVWAVTRDYLKSTRIAGGVGIAFAWLLFLSAIMSAFGGNLLGGVWLFFLATFLLNAAQSSIAYAQLRQLLGGARVREMMCRQPVTVDARLPLAEVVERYFFRYPYKAYPVVEDGKFLGMLTLNTLQEHDRAEWSVTRAGDVVSGQPPLPVIHPDEPVLQGLQKLAETGQSRLPVVQDGVFVGLLCARDIMSLVEIRAGLAVDRSQPESAGVFFGPQKRSGWPI